MSAKKSSKLRKWKLLEEEDVSPSPWFPVYKHKVELPNGKVVDDYYISKLGDVSMILAITTNKEAVFVRQYKHGAGEIILELPAGRVKKENTPQDEARIELQEETGYVAENIEKLGEIIFEPSKDTLKVFAYLARDVKERGRQNLDDTEEIEVLHVPVNKIDKMIMEGEIYASDTLAVLHLAKLKAPDVFK